MLSFNGQLVSRKDFCLSTANRAFRYGDGFFESMRVHHSTAMWQKYHYQRINKSVAALHLNMPDEWSEEYFTLSIKSLFNANHKPESVARVRFSVFRNDGGLYTPFTNNASFLIESETLDHENYVLNTKGITVLPYPDLKKAFNILSPLKSINAQLYVLASIYKRNLGFGDALILNEDGFIAEATSSNVFLYRSGKLLTPALSQACVEGVMRAVIIDIAHQQGIPIIETNISLDDLASAEEMFLTNAVQGIRWVKEFKGKRFGNEVAARLTDQLNERAMKCP